MTSRNAPEPYKNLEALDAEINLLRLWVARHSLERRLAETQAHAEEADDFPRRRRGGGSIPEIRDRLCTVVRQEKEARAGHDARLAAHCAARQPRLGIDSVCKEHGLSEDHQRRLIIAVTAMALGRPVAEFVMGEEGYCGGVATVGDLITHVIAPKSAAEWTQARRLFHPDSPLQGVIALGEPFGMESGESLHDKPVAISIPALAAVLEEDGILLEAEGSDNSVPDPS